ncbi:MAG: hypothetical protein M1372_01165 [Patescibacteria group bacterium]|nr:hypothetical protein [Patescibacteria group bacterium]
MLPFFWFKGGEVNLGGDSSRLYFYDPINYLKYFAVYGVVPSQTGEVIISYFFVPFTILMYILKLVIKSPNLLISLFYSTMLVTAFASVYLIIVDLLRVNNHKNNNNVFLAAILGGLFYILTPVVGFNWDKALVTHNQVFLNPLIFYLLLRYVNTRNSFYALLTVLITFIFSPNFSFISAPPFFAFYPLAFLYLFFYARFVRKVVIPWKRIAVFSGFFLAIQAFHIVPELMIFLDRTSNSFQRVFASSEISSALGSFMGTYPFIKLTYNFLALPQLPKPLFPFDFFLFVFPSILIIALVINSYTKLSATLKKNFLVLFIFFLIALFFDTANLTSLGASIYKFLFNFPGFGMFRNFYGQFMYVFYFFYAIVFGYSLFLILSYIKVKIKVVFSFLVFLLIVINGWPFVTGYMVNQTIYQSNNIKSSFKMDPEVGKVLDFVRSIPNDAKFLTLPLTDFGYQLFSGTNGGVYIGPSTIGYLGGKKDFPGYVGFNPFADLFLQFSKQKDYGSLKNLFAIFNIRFILYDKDRYIYENFPKFPYQTMKKVFPTQISYQEFIGSLGAMKVFGSGKFEAYSFPEENFLPHFYVAKQILPVKSLLDWEFVLPSSVFSRNRIVVEESPEKSIFSKAEKIDIYDRINKDFPLPVQYPFAKWAPSSIVYPFIILKEEYQKKKFKNSEDDYINAQLFFASKRISELSRWETPVLGNATNAQDLLSFKNPSHFRLPFIKNYNSFESVLSRYTKSIYDAVNLVNSSKKGLAWKIQKKSRITEVLSNHEQLVNLVIKNSHKKASDKSYLFRLADNLFGYYLSKVKVEEYDPSTLEYATSTGNHFGDVELLLKKDTAKGIDLNRVTVKVDSNKPLGLELQDEGNWLGLGKINLKNEQTPLVISFPSETMPQASSFYTEFTSNVSTEKDIVTLESFISQEKQFEGFVKRIRGFRETGHYLVSFEYTTYGDIFEMSMFLKNRNEYQDPSLDEYKPLFRESKIARNWRNFNAIIESKNLEEAVFQINPIKQKPKLTRISIKNFKVTKLPSHPDLILKNTIEPFTFGNTPQIIFTKINPTKYKVSVRNAKSPYVLVFSEAFNKQWKVFVRNAEKNDEKTTTNYFGGDIKEGQHKNIFFDSGIFETFGLKPIAEDRHFVANGYANGWHIEPSDAGGKSEYTFIVEMTVQRSFYVGLLISLVSFIGCLILIARIAVKKFYDR